MDVRDEFRETADRLVRWREARPDLFLRGAKGEYSQALVKEVLRTLMQCIDAGAFHESEMKHVRIALSGFYLWLILGPPPLPPNCPDIESGHFSSTLF